jgi:hypothetical protein
MASLMVYRLGSQCLRTVTLTSPRRRSPTSARRTVRSPNPVSCASRSSDGQHVPDASVCKAIAVNT